MLLNEPLAILITFFRTSLMKFYHNSQRMSDSFYHITESSVTISPNNIFQGTLNKILSQRLTHDRSCMFKMFR